MDFKVYCVVCYSVHPVVLKNLCASLFTCDQLKKENIKITR